MTYAEMGQHPAAAQALERFLAAADRGAVLGERLDDARRRLDDYQRTLARLKVAAQMPAEALAPVVFVDGERPDRPGEKNTGVPLPLALPLWLQPGTHSVRVAASGVRDYQVQVDLRPGELRQLSAELLPLSALSSLVPVSAELRHASDPSSIYKKWWFWTAVGSGAATVLTLSVGLIAAGATGKLSHTAAGSDLDPVDVAR
jgi:hypothetical protein